jgi:DNA mismatch repair protein MutS
VTRVLTPGTVVEDANLEAKGHNYLIALYYNREAGAGGLAWLDYSTGEWSGLHDKREDVLWQWIEKMAPRELLLPADYEPGGVSLDSLSVRRVPDKAFFDFTASARKVIAAQNVADLSVLDLDDKRELVQACGALITYLKQTQKTDLRHLSAFSPIRLSGRMFIDEVTERNLEIFKRLDGGRGKGTLFHVLDRTKTPMGARLLSDMLRRPFKDLRSITEHQEAVAYFHEHSGLRNETAVFLDKIYDLERLATRIFLNRAGPKDFLSLRQSLSVLPELSRILAETAAEDGGEPPAALDRVMSGWDALQDHREILERALTDNPPPLITEGGLFRRGYDQELDEMLDLAEHGEAKLKDMLVREKRETGLEKLKLGYNKVFGYYFELPKAQAAKAPYHFTRRQTLKGNERFTTEALKDLEEKLVGAQERRKELEYRLFQELREHVAEARPRFMAMAARLAELDYWRGLAEAAERNDWKRPEPYSGPEITIKAGRHPVVEAVQGGADYIPNDLALSADKRILIITGPNMAGKSTVLRQAAIICIMAQIGSFTPAAEARIGLADRIFSRVGASDNLAQGRSTFMTEMMEAARILRQAGKRSLVILDEIGRGTSTFDGMALAWSMVEELAGRVEGGVRTLFATHYHELTALEGLIKTVRNFNIAVKEYRGEIVFLRRMVPGPSDRSYGIEVAKLAGVPRSVVERAKQILADLETRSGHARGAPDPVAGQPRLPGMGETKGENTKRPHAVEALMHDLESIDIDRLTPLEALNLLQHWKATWLKKELTK